MSGNLWNQALERIRGRVNSHSFNTWFRPTQLQSSSGRTLTVRVPNPLFAEWLRNNYLPLISQALAEAGGSTREVVFTTGADAPVAAPDNGTQGPGARDLAEAPATSRPREGDVYAGSVLNPRYSFENFVVGGGNQFAHAAARAVAEKPFDAYNPLYIYGGAGLGKTHLMQAIANALLSGGRPLSVYYVTTETFMNELITAIRFENTFRFKGKYRKIDVLLVDDIQFLTGKERTQEEFFHTFNALYDARKQIVITSDCAPHDIPSLEERLRSRFQWGLIADIQPPDLETKIAILNKKAEAEGVALPSDVALFVASKIKSNVRELEGSLTRLLAEASMSGRVIDIDLAKETLQGLLDRDAAVVTIEAIQKQVAEYYNLKVSQLKSKNNARPISFPRQVAMFLCKNLTDRSLPEIGRKFGGKHHTTVIHALRKIEAMRKTDKEFDRVLNNLTQALR